MKISDRIIPSPQEITELKKKFVFNNQTVIGYSSKKSEINNIINLLITDLKKSDIKIIDVLPTLLLQNYTLVISNTDNIDLSKIVVPEKVDINEGYILGIETEYIVLSATTLAGLFYAAQTLLQLIDGKTVPGCKIRDWPEMAMRGVSDDVSRWQMSTLDNFKKILRILASYKLNTYMLYIEDVFKLKKHPLVGKNRGALTPAEIQEIVRYGKERFIDVIPIFQTLGHCEHLLRIPKYSDLAEVKFQPRSGPLLTPFGRETTMSPANPKTYQFIKDFASEFIPNFESKYINIGGDEPRDLGKGKSKKIADRIGLDNLYCQHMEKVVKMLAKYKKQVIVYADFLLNSWQRHNYDLKFKPTLNKKIILMNWIYTTQKEYPEVGKLSDAGYTQIVSPAIFNYVRLYPAYYKAKINIRNLVYTGWKTKNVIGAITSSWGDDGADNFRENNWYGYAYTSECAWHPDKVDDQTFTQRFVRQFYGADYGLSGIIDYLSNIDEIIRAARKPFMEDLVLIRQDKNKLNVLRKMLADCQRYSAMLEKIKNKIPENTDNIDYLKYSFNLAMILVNRFLILHKIACGEKVNKPKIIVHIKKLSHLKTEFAELWLRTNKPAGLWVTLWRLDKLINQWHALKKS